MALIYIVEDDRNIREIETIALSNSGHVIKSFETAKEFYGYEYETGGKGGWKAIFPDRENHAIDAVRYSREDDMRHVRIR